VACKSFATQESLIDVLIKGIDTWLNSTFLDPANFPAILYPLITAQSAIGWRQLFQGCFSSKWSRLQDQYLQEQGLLYADTTGTLWVTRMITVIWRQFFTMWEARKQKVHGHDQKTQKQALHRRLAAKFIFLYQQRHEVLMTDRDLFIESNDNDNVITFLENTSPEYIANWLQIWSPVIIDSAYAILSVQPLTTYFATLRPQPSCKRPLKP
jgi:hypothetical protein